MKPVSAMKNLLPIVFHLIRPMEPVRFVKDWVRFTGSVWTLSFLTNKICKMKGASCPWALSGIDIHLRQYRNSPGSSRWWTWGCAWGRAAARRSHCPSSRRPSRSIATWRFRPSGSRRGHPNRRNLVKLRGLRLATQFLTRLPVPGVEDVSAAEFSRSSAWFPFVGLVIGVVVAAILFVCSQRSAALGAAAGLVAWVWMTGALHLDGLADLTDALAAAHRDPQKFFPVLADPHVGAFGVVSIVLVLILKVAGLADLPPSALLALALIPAWARLGRWPGAAGSNHSSQDKASASPGICTPVGLYSGP